MENYVQQFKSVILLFIRYESLMKSFLIEAKNGFSYG